MGRVTDISLRAATESDRTYIERLFFLTEVWGDEEKPVRPTFVGELERYVHSWDEGQGGFIAMDAHGIPAGGLWMRRGDNPSLAADYLPDDDVLEILLAVEHRFRGRGIARLLIAAAERYALDHEMEKVSLIVENGNDGARALYEQLGYRLVNTVAEKGFFIMQKRVALP